MNDIMNMLETMIGSSQPKVGHREPFSSGRISDKERIAASKPSEEILLQKFSKTILENHFKRINEYTVTYSTFEQSFYTQTRAVDIRKMNDTLSLEKIVYYFTECQDTGMDLINNLADLASYAKNKDYNELQKRILSAYKVFNPNMVGFCNPIIDTPKDMNDIIVSLRSVQNRYVEGAPFIASENDMPIETIEERTKALLKYNTIMDNAAKDPLTALMNDMINQTQSHTDLKIKASDTLKNYAGDNAQLFTALKIGGKKEMLKQIKALVQAYSLMEDKLEVLASFTNNDNTLSYEKIKQYYIQSQLKFGSVESYLTDLNESVNGLISIVNSIFELYVADNSNGLTTVKDYLADQEFDTSEFIEEFYNDLQSVIKLATADIIFFAKRKSLNWNTEVDIKKLNNKFFKEIEKYGSDRKIQTRGNKKNKILDELLDN